MKLSSLFASLVAAGKDPVDVFEFLAGDSGKDMAKELPDSDDDEPTDPRYKPVWPMGGGAAASNASPAKRRSKRNGPRVWYRATKSAMRAAQNGTGPSVGAIRELFPTASAVMRAVAKSKSPLSNHDIETKTGLGKKTVESCVYHLRHAGLIESVTQSK